MNRNRFSKLVVVALLLLPRWALAHAKGDGDDLPRSLGELWRYWEFDVGTVICLAGSAALYAAGLVRMWRAAGVGHGVRRWEAVCFAGGWIVLCAALVSPIHPLGEILFSAHMVQHELLMLVAAPLLVLGRPLAVTLRGLPANASRRLARLSNTPLWKRSWSLVAAPFSAWLIHAIVLWTWHAPLLFQATLTNDWIHAAQHLCFVLSAVLFWWAIFHGHGGAKNDGVAVLYLFTTAVHSGLLGALLTFSHTTWYPAYDDTADWGLSGLEDQQLGGLIMWVPACTVYIIAGLYFFARWMKHSDARIVSPAHTAASMAAVAPQGGRS